MELHGDTPSGRCCGGDSGGCGGSGESFGVADWMRFRHTPREVVLMLCPGAHLVPLPLFAMVGTPNDQHFVVWPESSGHVRSGQRVLPSVHRDAQDALARSAQDRWDRARVSGTIQSVSETERDPRADWDALRRAESVASKSD